MSALRAWRQRFGVAGHVAAAVMGISPELFERIENGSVEPAPDIALRIYVVTCGEVPLSTWENVRLQLLDSFRCSAIVAKAPPGWGVNLFLGSEVVARLSPGEARQLAADLVAGADLAAEPPAPMPLFPMELAE